MTHFAYHIRLHAGALLITVLLVSGMSSESYSQNSEETNGDGAPDSTNYQERSRSELQEILRNKIQTLQNVREQKFEAQQQLNRTIQNAMSKRNVLNEELNQLRSKRSEREQEIKQLKKQINSLKKKRDRLQRMVDTLSSSATTLRDALSTHVKQTAPYHRDARTEDLDLAPSSLRNNPIKTLRDLLDHTRNELTDETSSELFHERVPLSEASTRKKHARLVRIGQNTLFFVTEDGKQAGYYVRENGKWKVKPASADQKKRFQQAINIIRKQERPARVPLPVIIQREQP